MIRLDNKKILVTGASSGIGRETCIQLSELGAKVVLLARDEPRLNETLSMMSGNGHKCISFDLENIKGIKKLIQDAVAYDNIKLDGFVHCAGIPAIFPLRIIDEKKVDFAFKLHTLSYIEIIKHLSKKNFSNECSSIVFISAILTKKPKPSQALYISSKASSDSLSKALSLELIKRRIRINSILAGGVATKMAQDTERYRALGSDSKESSTYKKTLPKTLSCREVSNMVVFLLSDSAKYIIGESYYCDGGYF